MFICFPFQPKLKHNSWCQHATGEQNGIHSDRNSQLQTTVDSNPEIDSTHTDEHWAKVVINEFQSDQQEMLATLKSAATRTTDIAHHHINYKLIIQQQPLCNAMGDQKN